MLACPSSPVDSSGLPARVRVTVRVWVDYLILTLGSMKHLRWSVSHRGEFAILLCWPELVGFSRVRYVYRARELGFRLRVRVNHNVRPTAKTA